MKKHEKISLFAFSIVMAFGLMKLLTHRVVEVDEKVSSTHLSQGHKKLVKKANEVSGTSLNTRKPARSFNYQAAIKERTERIKKMRQAKPDSFKYVPLSKTDDMTIKNQFGKKYKVLSDYVAIKKTEHNKEDFKGATQKLGHFIVPVDMATNESLPVVENTDNGKLGILTGVISLKLKDLSQVNYLLNHSNFEVKKTLDHISVVYLKFFDLETLMTSYEELSNNKEVIRSNIEILEYQRFEK